MYYEITEREGKRTKYETRSREGKGKEKNKQKEKEGKNKSWRGKKRTRRKLEGRETDCGRLKERKAFHL